MCSTASASLLTWVWAFLTVEDICNFDSAITNHYIRGIILETYKQISLDESLYKSASVWHRRWIRLKGFQMKWECPLCSFQNDGDVWNQECEMCGVERSIRE